MRNEILGKIEMFLSGLLFGVWLIPPVSVLAAEPPVKLRVGYGSAASGQVPPRAMREFKFFERHGLDVEFLLMGGNLVAQSFLAGEIPMALMTGGLALASHVNGSDIVMIASNMNTIPYHLMARPNLSKPQDLKGKIAGISRFGAGSDRGLRFALRKLGINPEKELTIIQAGGDHERFAALLNGKLDVTVITPPMTRKARDAGMRTLLDLSSAGIQYQHTGVVTSRAFIKKNEAAVSKFIKGLIEGTHFLKTHKSETISMMGRLLRIEDRDLLEEAYEFYIAKNLPAKPYPTLEGLKTVLAELAEVNPKAKSADPAGLIEERFVRELDQSGFIDALYK